VGRVDPKMGGIKLEQRNLKSEENFKNKEENSLTLKE